MERIVGNPRSRIGVGKVTLSDIYIFLLSIWLFLLGLISGTTLSGLQSVYLLLYQMNRLIWGIFRMFIIAKVLLQLEKSDWKIFILGFIGLISGYFGDGTWVSTMLWLICGSKRVDLNKMLNCIFVSHLVSYLIVILLGSTGIITDTIMMRGDSSSFRHSLGFYHPNTLASKTFQLLALYICVKRNHLKYIDVCVIGVVSIFVFKITDSISGGIILLGLTILSMVACFAKKSKPRSVLRNIARNILDKAKYATIVIPFFATYVMLNVNKITSAFTGTLASRASQTFLYFKTYGLSLFGKELEINSGIAGWSLRSNLYTLDNSYMYMLLGYGVVCFTLFLVSELLIVLKASREKDFVILVVLALYALYGFSEVLMIQVNLNFTLLLLGTILWGDDGRRPRVRVKFRRRY